MRSHAADAMLRCEIAAVYEARILYSQIIEDALLLPAFFGGTDNTSSSQLLVSIENPALLLPRRVFYVCGKASFRCHS